MGLSYKRRRSGVGQSAGNLRHSLVDGLDSITHGKLIYDFLGSFLKVHFPCIIPFGVRNLHHTIILDVRHIMEEILRKRKQKAA